jgi:uncharacterized protein (TIGR00730 family)
MTKDAPRILNICVFCGSANGIALAYQEAAGELGRIFAKAGIRLIYGGGSTGLMGTLARSVLTHGGQVTGIIPDFLEARELMLKDAQETIVVPDMHTRKRLMFERADAFVALPGGIGTLEELVEQMTWVQLEQHSKPVLIADVDGFWRPLLDLFAHMRQNGFVREPFEIRYLVAEKIDDVLPMVEAAAERHALFGGTKMAVDPRL